MTQKVKKHRFLKFLWLLHTPKKFIKSHLLRLGSGSGPRRSDPYPTQKVEIRRDPDPQHCFLEAKKLFQMLSFLVKKKKN
jgi:hypothetical protein